MVMINEFPSLQSQIFNLDGNLGFFEKFFAHQGRTYRIIRYPYVVENTKYHSQESTLFKVCKIFSYITVFGIFFIYIGKLVQRKLKNYILLPEERHPEIKYMTIRQRKRNLESASYDDKTLQGYLNQASYTLYKSMLKCIQIKINPQIDRILQDQKLIENAWNKVERLCLHASFLNPGLKKHVIETITQEEGVSFGIKKVIFNRMEKYPNTEHANISSFIKHPDTAIKILYYQMLMILSRNKHKGSMQFHKKIQFLRESKTIPDIKRILYKKEPILSIQNKISSFLITLQNKKIFELRFLNKKNDQEDHSVFVGVSEKKFRFYDEYLGLSYWLNAEQLANFIKNRLLWDKDFPLCELTI